MKTTTKRYQQRVGESDQAYFRRAANYARRKYGELLAEHEYRYCHRSFALRDALLAAEERYELGTFGVEYISAGNNRRAPAITYLNSGDTCKTTILVINGRFLVGCWGSIVERGNYP